MGGGYADGDYGGLRAVGRKLGNGEAAAECVGRYPARRADAGGGVNPSLFQPVALAAGRRAAVDAGDADPSSAAAFYPVAFLYRAGGGVGSGIGKRRRSVITGRGA